MSKSALKKELVTFTNEQLVEVILNAYSASKEAKDYFEFFLNPDAEALADKKIDLIAKEIARNRHGYCKGRISVIRKHIKDYAAFVGDAEAIGRLMLAALRMLAANYRYRRYSETLLKGTLKLAHDYLAYASDNGFLTAAVDNLTALCDDKTISSESMRSYLKDIVRKKE